MLVTITLDTTQQSDLVALLKLIESERTPVKEMKPRAGKKVDAEQSTETEPDATDAAEAGMQSTDKPAKEVIQAAVAKKAQAGKIKEIKALLTEFETDSVSNLVEESYVPFLAKVNAL